MPRTEPGAGAEPGAKPEPPRRRRPHVALVAAAAAALVLVLVASVVVHLTNATRFGPEATVRLYLTAISEGKASQANALVDAGVAGAAAALLTDDVLAAAPARIEGARVTGVSTSGDTAVARVAYNVDGTAFTDELELSRAGTQGVFFDVWRIDEPMLSAITVGTDRGTTVSVNGTDVDISAQQELTAYPGSYQIGAPTHGFFVTQPRTIVAGTGTDAPREVVDLHFTVTAALTTAVQGALNRHLDDCVASTTDDPDGCGLYTGAALDFAGEPTLAYTVDAYPVAVVDESGGSFSTEGGRVTATATGTLFGGGTGTRVYTTAGGWKLTGSIVFEGSDVRLEDVY